MHRPHTLTKKPAHLADETCPGGIAGQKDVIAAFERDEPCSGNATGDQPAVLERYSSVIAAMHHERGYGDIRQKVENVEISNRPEQSGSVLGRGESRWRSLNQSISSSVASGTNSDVEAAERRGCPAPSPVGSGR